MTIACLITYYILEPFVRQPNDFLGGMGSTIATVFVFGEAKNPSLHARGRPLLCNVRQLCTDLCLSLVLPIQPCCHGGDHWSGVHHRDVAGGLGMFCSYSMIKGKSFESSEWCSSPLPLQHLPAAFIEYTLPPSPQRGSKALASSSTPPTLIAKLIAKSTNSDGVR